MITVKRWAMKTHPSRLLNIQGQLISTHRFFQSMFVKHNSAFMSIFGACYRCRFPCPNPDPLNPSLRMELKASLAQDPLVSVHTTVWECLQPTGWVTQPDDCCKPHAAKDWTRSYGTAVRFTASLSHLILKAAWWDWRLHAHLVC